MPYTPSVDFSFQPELMTGTIAPFLPHRSVGQQLDVNTADYRARLESTLFAIERPIPIRQWHPVGRFINKPINWTNESSKIFRRLCQRCRPSNPIQFSVCLASVERESVPVL